MNEVDLKIKKLAILTGAVLFVVSLVAHSVFSVPSGFGKNRLVNIKQGSGLNEIAADLKKDGVIKSPLVFKALTFLFLEHKNIKAGDYFFEEPFSVFGTVKRLTRGAYGLSPTRATVLEGWTAWQMGGYFEELGFFSREKWTESAEDKEGYLFPDTYFFLPNTGVKRVIEIMRENFNAKVSPLLADIESAGRSFEDIVVIASIIEKEASDFEDAKIISGILWKRLDAGMGLQVDAALTYVTGKSSMELTEKDLAIDSPYNTYKYRGLPPTPIGNPGLDAIKAAVYPEETLYWYYLHGRDGEPRYAVDFEEHKENKQKYLR